MSIRKEALERHFEREEERLQRQLDAGMLSHEEYNAEARELQREAQAEAREARWQDLDDVNNDWNF